MPVNPILAHPAYLAGYIEEMGTGTSDIIDKCLDAGLDMPEFIQDGAFKVVIWREDNADSGNLQVNEGGVDEELYRWEIRQKQIKQQRALFVNKARRGNHSSVIEKQKMVVEFCTEPRTSNEIMEHIGLKHRYNVKHRYIDPLIDSGFFVMTIPEKPNSRSQKYKRVLT
jgi:predicted HTH transcriptional regulator